VVNVIPATDTTGAPCIGLVLGAQNVFLKDGSPTPGAALMPAQAREVAYLLLLFAQRLDNGKPDLFESTPAEGRGESPKASG